MKLKFGGIPHSTVGRKVVPENFLDSAINWPEYMIFKNKNSLLLSKTITHIQDDSYCCDTFKHANTQGIMIFLGQSYMFY